VYRRLMDGSNIILSAPTSFGKSLVIDALVASEKFKNIVVVVPTIALIDETRRRLSKFAPEFKIITHVSQSYAERNLLVLTQERVLDLESLPNLDLFVVDEFYKLSPEREQLPDRAYLLNQAFQRLYRTGAQFYFLGPNIRALAAGIPEDFYGRIDFIKTGVSTVALDEVTIDGGADPLQTLTELCARLEDPTLIYCQSPRSARAVLRALIDGGIGAPDVSLDRAVEWVGRTYHPEWSVCEGLARGIGVHHGQLPRALSHYMVDAFRARRLRFLICTSTLIEGVNTPAKNVVVFDKKIGNTNFDFFDFGNIRGRSGRMSVHYVGKVFLFHRRPDEELPDVDIPALSQPATAPSSLLLGMEDEELTETSRERLKELLDGAPLPAEVLKESTGFSVERQLETAAEIEARFEALAPLLSWHGVPSKRELDVACELVWGKLHGARKEHGAYSAAQLAVRLGQLRDHPDPGDFIASEVQNSYHVERGHSVDEIAEEVMDFMRFWASHNFPKLLRALDHIARYVLSRRGFPTGDFTVYAAQVENLFGPANAVALEEYGLPRNVTMRLRDVLPIEGSLDEMLDALARLQGEPHRLDDFELELLDDVRESLATRL
ncbi:MAG TPA: DEAD/DEAH box helicase, partial [Polyangiaceae bacterium]